MRIPVPVVLLLVFAVAGGVWWWNTRGADFMTPPSDVQLSSIRERAMATVAKPQREGEPVKPPVLRVPDPAVPVEEKPPGIELGDIDSPPTLEAYSERALDGAAKLAELAAMLEKEGEFQRALLAWERTLDSTQPDPSQAAAAIAAIRRLRPTLPDWNTDTNAAIPVVLHAGTGPALADAIRPVLEEVAKELTANSSGLLKVTSDLAVGKRISSKGPIPVAVWLSGPTKDSPSTDVLSFTVDKDEILADEVYQTAFQLISSQVKRGVQLTPLAEPLPGETPRQALQSNLTRLAWREFGKTLNAAAEEPGQ